MVATKSHALLSAATRPAIGEFSSVNTLTTSKPRATALVASKAPVENGSTIATASLSSSEDTSATVSVFVKDAIFWTGTHCFFSSSRFRKSWA